MLHGSCFHPEINVHWFLFPRQPWRQRRWNARTNIKHMLLRLNGIWKVHSCQAIHRCNPILRHVRKVKCEWNLQDRWGGVTEATLVCFFINERFDVANYIGQSKSEVCCKVECYKDHIALKFDKQLSRWSVVSRKRVIYSTLSILMQGAITWKLARNMP